MGKIIAVANQKGGVGKTTTCVNLTCALKKRGRRVLLIDCDPQGNSTSGMGVDKTVTPNCYDLLMNGAAAADCIRSTKYGDVLPANMNLSGCSVELVGSAQREYIMKNALSPVQADYDFILIDCPPSLELLTINALVAADSVLIPVQCEYYALEGIADLMRSIKMCNKRLNPELSVQGIVMTMYDGRTKLSDQVVNEVRKFFGKKVYKTMIPRNVRLSEAPSHRKPAIAYDKESKGARAYLHLAGELIKREEKAAKLAGIDDAIRSLPDGYATLCTDGMFSQGEWQLLSIARAAAADPSILLLDEITANLDAETEARVLEALRRACKGRTVLSISHRIYENLGGRTVEIGSDNGRI